MESLIRVSFWIVVAFLLGTSQASAEPTTREMNLLTWQEFAELVPEQTRTVLVPVGTLEAHGVIPNGADNLAPEAMARELAGRVNALIAPTLNYGVTGSLDAFPGTFSIKGDTYAAFVEDILTGLARNGFKNIIILNGHGGPQTAILEEVAPKVGRQERVRTLVMNWWSVASDITLEVFEQDGGHAGNNETAYIMEVVPEHIHPERYSPQMASPSSSGAGWSAYPFPSSIVLYKEGEGYPDFDSDRAREYYRRVNQKVGDVIVSMIGKWDMAGIFDSTNGRPR